MLVLRCLDPINYGKKERRYRGKKNVSMDTSSVVNPNVGEDMVEIGTNIEVRPRPTNGTTLSASRREISDIEIPDTDQGYNNVIISINIL